MAELAAVGTSSQVNYVEETTYGTTPTTPAMKIVRALIGTKFDLKRETFSSKEMSTKRQVLGMTYGTKSGSMSLPFELSYGSFDDFISAAMGDTQTWSGGNISKIGNTKRSFTFEQNWPDINVNEINTGVVITGFDLSVKPNAIVTGTFNGMFKDQISDQYVANATNGTATTAATTITRSSGSFLTDGFAGVGGDNVEITGCVTSANNKRVVTVSATATVLTFAASTFVATFDTTSSLIKVSKVCSASAATAVNTNTVFDSFTGLATEGGASIAIITGMDLKLDQSANTSNALFDETPQQIALGTVNVGGTMTVRFINNSLKKKFLAGTTSDISFTLGVTNKVYKFDMSGVKYSSVSTDASEGELTQQLAFTAIYDATDATSLMITRTP